MLPSAHADFKRKLGTTRCSNSTAATRQLRPPCRRTRSLDRVAAVELNEAAGNKAVSPVSGPGVNIDLPPLHTGYRRAPGASMHERGEWKHEGRKRGKRVSTSAPAPLSTLYLSPPEFRAVPLLAHRTMVRAAFQALVRRPAAIADRGETPTLRETGGGFRAR